MPSPPHRLQADPDALKRMGAYDRMPPKTRRAIANAANPLPDGVFVPALCAGMSDGAVAQLCIQTDAWAVARAEQKRDLY